MSEPKIPLSTRIAYAFGQHYAAHAASPTMDSGVLAKIGLAHVELIGEVVKLERQLADVPFESQFLEDAETYADYLIDDTKNTNPDAHDQFTRSYKALVAARARSK